MSTKEKILNSIQPVVKFSRSVRIDTEKASLLAESLKNATLPTWDQELQFRGNAVDTVQYYFLLDSINFCFWAPKDQARWEYKKGVNWIRGYYAFSYAIKEAIKENPELLKPEYLREITLEDFSKIFTGRGDLQLLKERHQIIQENSNILQDKFKGSAYEMVRSCQGDVNRLVDTLRSNFPSFNDCYKFKGKNVYFLKRAQIFPSDLYNAFEGKDIGRLKNLGDLTIFADYKIPQLLLSKGVLIYGKALLERINKEELILAGSEEELEIRANTIQACEIIKSKIELSGRSLTSAELDWILWLKAKETKFKTPYHKTISIYY